LDRSKKIVLLKSILLTVIFCFLYSYVSCKKDNISFKIKIKSEFNNIGLKKPVGIDEYKEKYYILDADLNSIFIVDKKTHKVQKKFGNIGQGPGEFFSPGYLSIAKGIISVFEHRNKRIQILKTNGEYLSEIPDSPFPWKAFCMNSQGEIILGQPQKGFLISVYDTKGNLRRTFGNLKKISEIYGLNNPSFEETYKIALNRILLCTDNEDNIYAVFIFAPLIQKYNANGDLIAEKKIKGKEINEFIKYFPKTSKPTGLMKTSLDGVTIYHFFLSATIDPILNNLIILTGLGNLYIYDKDLLKKKGEVQIDSSLHKGVIYKLQSGDKELFFITVFQSGIFEIEY